MARIEIDKESGFCFGVVTAIRKAEEQLAAGTPLYCLGDIVHNSDEVERLRAKGLRTITHSEMAALSNARVLLRAHGEPPSTYAMARERNIEIVDATCPVVLKLQQRVKAAYDREGERPQIVICGKLGHAEVNDDDVVFEHYDTICRSVSGRVDRLRNFAASHAVVLFVAGTKSSNGRILYDECHAVNPDTHLIANASHLDPSWLKGAESIGICGATSTPLWLMEQVRDAAAAYTSEDE